MPLFRGSLPNASSFASATITVIETITETLLNASTPRDHGGSMWANEDSDLTHPSMARVFHLVLVLCIPVVWWHARRQQALLNKKHEKRLADEQASDAAWSQPWQTNDWEILYGLMGLANDNRWTRRTSFHGYPSIYKVWHQQNRPWLKRLMAMGVIPLAIQDGGMDTYRVNFHAFGLRKRFPYIKWPQFQQGKKRSCFEFLVPRPHDNIKRRDFLEAVVNNRTALTERQHHGYGVTVRYGPPDQGPIYYSMMNPPPTEEEPLEVGARSALEPLLPFKSDKVLRRGHGKRCNSLSFYLRGFDPRKVPLLKDNETILVRIEAKHFGRDQLDRFVFHLAQVADMDVEWPEGRCREAALLELERCGLPADGLRPFELSVPGRYR